MIITNESNVKTETGESPEESISLIRTNYCRLLKNYIDCGRIPPVYQHYVWNVHSHCTVFGTSFRGLQDFVFDTFCSVEPKTEVKISTSSEPIKSEGSENSEETSELDLTGCPLECPFEFSCSEDSHPDSPQKQETKKNRLAVCNAKHARLLVNLYLSELTKSLPTPVPTLILCDGQDPARTLLLGAFKEFNSVTHVQATKLPGTFSRKSMESISVFKKQHEDLFPVKPLYTEMEANAVYQILEPSTLCVSALSLNCKWKNSPILSPSENSLCTLDAEIALGQESPVSFLYKELAFLKRTIEGLETGDITWCIEDQDEKVSVNDEIQKLLQATREVRNWRTNQEEPLEVDDHKDVDAWIEKILIRKRQNMDFTDKLWNALMKAASYTDVKDGLSCIANAIFSGDINPVILRNNKTSLGQWISNRSKCEKEPLPLDGQEPVRHLGEIGLRKIQEDYCSLFVGLELATVDMLAPYLQSWEDRKEGLRSLHLLHAALELVLLCKVYLSLPQSSLRSFVREILKENCREDMSRYKFSFCVPVLDSHRKLQDLNPSEWQVCFTSTCSTVTKRTAFHFASKMIPHLRGNFSDLSVDDMYYGTKYVLLQHYF